MEVLWTDDFVSFESRHRVFNEIMETLRDENASIIGICGMGGIGKTKLVMEIGKKAKKEELFDNVVMTIASQDPDIRRMQGILADMLRLVFKGTSEAERAAELSERLKKERRVLIILDDVWEKFSLADIGMPSTLDHKCCKLVLTTRRKQVCDDMCCQRTFLLNVLDDHEALSLFSKHARITPSGNPQYHSKAKQVVKECRGLPLAIETVGSALRNKTLDDYDDAIWKLSRSAYVDIESVDREIYPAIKLSLDYLNCEETVRCLTLFSLYPEDRIITLEDLTRIAFGIGLFENINSVEEARQNTLRCVTRLLDACLLSPTQRTLESWNSFHRETYDEWNIALVLHKRMPSVKVHDIVRDVALWLSRKDKFFYMEKSPSKKQSKEYENAIAISMKDCSLDCRLKCPKLKLLLVETGISGLQDACFEMMGALQALKLNVIFRSDAKMFAESTFPASIQHLHSLRTFLFNSIYDRWCTGNLLSVILMLKNLQILSLESEHIKELPQLSSLKLLDLSRCWNLEQIPQNVLSRLTALEELYLGLEPAVEKDVFLEITFLPHLTALTARVNFAGSLPSVSFRKPLRRYGIFSKPGQFAVPYSRKVALDVVDCSKMASLQQLFPQIECLCIHRLQGTWENLFPGCSEDPLLRIDACDVDCLIDTRRTCHVHPTPSFSNLQRLVLDDMSAMTRLCNGPPPPCWLPNLREARISHYHGSHNIVPHIIPIGSKLQVLQVEECPMLKFIFEVDPQYLQAIKNEMSLLPSPRVLCLTDLHELTAIWKWPHQMGTLDLTKNDSDDDDFCNLIPEAMFRSLNSLAELEISRCEKVEEVFQLIDYNDQKYKEQLSNLCVLQLFELSQLRYIWKGPQQHLHLRKLECIELSNCSKLTSIFTPASATSLRKLRSIKIIECEALESIISAEEDELSTSAASLLMVVSINIPELEEIYISSCHELKSILPVSILAQGLPQLRDISIADCAELEQVFGDGEGTLMNRDEIALNSLKKLELVNLPSLVHFSTMNGRLVFPSLKELKVKWCPLLGKSFRIGQAVDGYVHRKEQVELQNLNNNEVVEGKLLGYYQDIVWMLPLQNFVSLKSVEFTDFHEAKELFDFSGRIIDQPLCSKLESLILQSWTTLNQIWRGPLRSVRLLYLKCLCIYKCPNLRTLFTSTIAGALEKLEMIEIEDCINLETVLVMSELDFPALSQINIKGCNNLKSVLRLSVAQELPLLRSLKIENCPILQHVFSADEGQHRDYGNLHKIKLPNLCTLKLAKVPSSMLFTSANLLVSYPNLQDLFFEGIEASQPTHLALRFLDTEAAEPSVVFNEFPVLNCPWKSPTNFIKMTCLSYIQVGNCVGLKTLFTQSIAQTLCFLETIVICNCQELEYIIEPSDHHVEGEEESFSTVTHLERLREIKVEGCERLKFIFPLSVAQRLPSLQGIIVKGARLLEQVIVNDERTGCAKNEVIVLPYLRILKLEDIPRLSRIFPTGYSLSRSSVAYLEEVFIANCIIEEGFELRDHQTEILDLTKNDSHDEVYNLIPEAMFKSFDLNQIWTEPLRSVRLRYLKCLCIYECPNLRTLFTSTIAGALKKLEMIEIGNCINLETILVMSELDFSDELPFFPTLSKINIKECNKLKSVLRLSVARELPLLQSLEIENCPVLQHVFSADEGQHRDYGNLHEIRLSNLRSLKLAKVPSSMLFTSANLLASYPNLQDLFFEGIEASQPTHLALRFLDTEAAGPSVVLNEFPVLNCPWKSSTNFVKMTCLSHIQVGNCVGLKTLFTQSIAQTLCFLETIVICNCQELEYIIKPSDHHVEGEEEGFSTVTHLERLREIKVEGCERLKFIFLLSVAQRLPSLQEIIVKQARLLEQVIVNDERTGCAKNEVIVLPYLRILKLEDLPRLSRIFPTGYSLSRPSVANLEEVFIANCNIEEAFELRDLQTETLDLTKNDSHDEVYNLIPEAMFKSFDLNQIWREPLRSVRLRYLKCLCIYECPNLRTLFTSTIAGALKKLEMIEIGNCINLETILVMSELDFSDELPFFPALSKINIKGCNKLKSVLRLSVTRELPLLQSLEIENCPVLQHVFSADEGQHRDYGNLHEIRLSNLRSLKLAKVPSSMLFTSANLLASYPNLQDLFFEGIEASQPTHLALRFLDTEAAKPSTLEGMDASDINDVCLRLADIRLFEPKVVLNEFPVLNCPWRSPTNFVKVTCLSHIQVGNCVGLKTLFTQSIAQTLCSLETIVINNCQELEYIVEPSDHHVEGEEESFSAVTHLERLREIKVKGCERLKFIFPLSVAQRLPSLQVIVVKGARQLEQVIGNDERKGRAKNEETVLPCLRILRLEDLPRLSRIFPTGYGLSRSSVANLEEVFIANCNIQEGFDLRDEVNSLSHEPGALNLK